jgi:nicotinamidase-related amidase
MTTTLLVIDLQNDYFPGGAYPLVGADDAVAVARTVLDRVRAEGVPVVHMQHVWDAPDAEFMRPGTPGIEIHPLAQPSDGEALLQKEHPNSFLGTGLALRLADLGTERLVVLGMMTSMCVDASVRAALDLGFTTVVVGDACAAPDLSYGDRVVDGGSVHTAFLAALRDAGADVVTAADLAIPAVE